MMFLGLVKDIINKFKLRIRPDIKIGNKVEIGCNVICEGANLLASKVYICNSKLGYASYIGVNSSIENCNIGRYTCIGPRVYTVIGKHPVSKFVSIHPAFFSTQKQVGFSFVDVSKFEEFEKKDENGYSINIGSDVWIGANVLVMDGITIGDGAIIGAGTIVNKNIPDYAIAVGNPVRIIKYRFEQKEIDRLRKIRWWEKDYQWILGHAEYFDDIQQFFEKLKDETYE